MRPLNLVLCTNNPHSASQVSTYLSDESPRIIASDHKGEIRAALESARVDVAILDLEICGLDDVRQLCREFPDTAFVCTHRLADEKIWMKALDAGAEDCCFTEDSAAIANAVRQCTGRMKAAAA